MNNGMMTDINYDRAAQIAAELLTESQKMIETFDSLKSYFSEINNGSGIFDGTAASEVRAKFDSFASTFHVFNEAVESYAKYIQTASENYQKVDKASQNAVSGL